MAKHCSVDTLAVLLEFMALPVTRKGATRLHFSDLVEAPFR
ncbi:hypothetical protein SOVF_080350 [Spinacia oleracea]|nr:hypothetical protein SOVF_080350 [Spinacia oleracea]